MKVSSFRRVLLKRNLCPTFLQNPSCGIPFARPLPADTIENGPHPSSELLGRAQQPVELSTFVLVAARAKRC